MAFRLSDLAQQDLKEIGDYIGQRNPTAAEQVLDELVEKLELLGRIPTIGGRRDEVRAGLRFSVVRKYVIYYRISGDDIDILRVIHGARDIDAIRFE